MWQPHRRQRTRLDPDVLSLLLRFGEGSTVADAAGAAGIEVDATVDEAIAMLERAELLVPVLVRLETPAPAAYARIAELVDRDSFVALGSDPIATGFARIADREVAIAAWEPDATSGIAAVLALQAEALDRRCPVIYVLDRFSIGHTTTDFLGRDSIGRVYANQARLSGVVPQIAIVCGALWRPAALLPVGCDAVIFVAEHGTVSIGDVGIVKELTGEDVTEQELGGARMHAEHSGLAHLVARSTADAAALCRRYLSFTTGPVPGRASTALTAAEVDALVPDDADRPFPIDQLVRAIADDGSLLELRAGYARELSTTFARLDGTAIGVIANCSQHKAGLITVEAADKAARFIALCGAYGLPIVFLVDVLGLAIGRAAERAGIERAAGRLFSAIANTPSTKLTLVVRKAHTAGFFAMAGPAFDPEAFLALSTASIAILSERSSVPGIAALERILDPVARESVRGYVRSHRPPPELATPEVVRASEARTSLIAHLRARPPSIEPRPRVIIPS